MADDMTFAPRKGLLSLDELEQVARCFISAGVKKIRITGGEPLVRRDIMQLFRRLSRYLADQHLTELTLTTNGTQLQRCAGELRDLGVQRANVSLDTLDGAKFLTVTRGGLLEDVLRGIEAARSVGISVKINAVALKDFTEHEVDDLIGFAHSRGMTLTFIETMPLGDVGADRTEQFLSLKTLRRCIEQNWTLIDLSERTGGPARYARVAETGGKIGFIAPLTHNFCEDCNRVRVTASGILYPCLGQMNAVDLKTSLRGNGGDAEVLRAISSGIHGKPRGHDFEIAPGNQVRLARHMSATGG